MVKRAFILSDSCFTAPLKHTTGLSAVKPLPYAGSLTDREGKHKAQNTDVAEKRGK